MAASSARSPRPSVWSSPLPGRKRVSAASRTLVTVSFAEESGKTRMTFRQVPFQSIEERDGHRGGWTSTFDRLDEHLSTLSGSAQ